MTKRYIELLMAYSKITEPTTPLNIIADDPADNKILECAIAAKADMIVSGDHHLLEIKEYEEIKIVTATKFLKTMHKK
jgi:hypothetical protein